MLEPARLEYMRERARQLNGELLVISKDPGEVDDIGHSGKEQIEQIYA